MDRVGMSRMERKGMVRIEVDDANRGLVEVDGKERQGD